MKIWVKVLDEEKLIKSEIVETDIKLNEPNFSKILISICNQLDLPTPISLKYHYKCYNEFNMVKYIPADFVEDVKFSCLILENCIDK